MVRSRTAAWTAIVALASVWAPAGAARASSCPTQWLVWSGGIKAGLVYAGHSEWLSFDTASTVTITVQPLTGDVDLYVYVRDDACALVGESRSGLLLPDSVRVGPGAYSVEVRYYYAAAGPVGYVART